MIQIRKITKNNFVFLKITSIFVRFFWGGELNNGL